jgi:hypothetical protein
MKFGQGDEGKPWIKIGWLALKHAWETWTKPSYTPMGWTKQSSKDLSSLFKKALKQKNDTLHNPTLEEQLILQSINTRTVRHNQNNVTRTQAYWDFYRNYPEIHWSHLAHMVSRNGGWNMTDLRGDMLSQILTSTEGKHFFEFLERCNALIFQDAYPQLLLYEESKRKGAAQFHLLPFLGVSRFMEVMWGRFWKFRDSAEITVAMVINEQQYIEERVVKHPHYRKTVLETWEFKAQTLLQMNEVFFPYHVSGSQKVHLAGQVCRDFSSLDERIDLGKKLYAILFGNSEIFRGVLEWVQNQRHTGSREDYWPQLFSKVKLTSPGTEYTRRLSGCDLLPSADKLYSPRLEDAWPNQKLAPPGGRDWFVNEGVVKYLERIPTHVPFRLTEDYCNTLNTVEAAILLKENVND